jgi:hypothetical protein
MAVPTAYTEDTLKAYMHGRLGGMASILEWTVAGGSYDEIVNDTLFGYGQTDISLITGAANIQLLRAYAGYYLWMAVAGGLANQMDYTHADSGATYKRSQLYDHALKMAQAAEDEITALGGDVSGIAVTWKDIVYTDDLYTATDNSLMAGNEWSRINP